MNTHPVAETATAAMSRRTVARRSNVPSFMLHLLSQRLDLSKWAWGADDRFPSLKYTRVPVYGKTKVNWFAFTRRTGTWCSICLHWMAKASARDPFGRTGDAGAARSGLQLIIPANGGRPEPVSRHPGSLGKSFRAAEAHIQSWGVLLARGVSLPRQRFIGMSDALRHFMAHSATGRPQ
jgi:hypothetical protein